MLRKVSIRRRTPADWRPAEFSVPDKDVAFLHFLVKDPSQMLRYMGNPSHGKIFRRSVVLANL
jgi:hypothetical protein